MSVEMILKLNQPGMTALHKAGLAGLYLTLDAFEQSATTVEGLAWELGATEIRLTWMHDTPKAAFNELVKKSFRIEDGFIRLPGLEPDTEMTKAQQHHLYQALLNSFLQFGPHRPTGTKQSRACTIEDKVFWIKDFAPILKIRQHEAVTDFINSIGNFKSEIETAGWLYPGGGQRHVAYKETTLSDKLQSAFALLFAPVGVVYYLVNSKLAGRKSRLAMLIPNIRDLESYAAVRRVIASSGVLEMSASSASDAALRMLLSIETQQTKRELEDLSTENFLCRVVTFGIVSWNEKQKTRTDTRNVFAGKISGFDNYRIADRIFKNRLQPFTAKIKDESGKNVEKDSVFVTTSAAREIIADNVADNKAWYHDIATFISSAEARKRLLYERKELYQMIMEAKFDDETKRLFIQICHDSWSRRLGKLGDRARKEKADFNSLVKKDAEKLRTALMRSKNAETVRETVVDLWARAGLNKKLEGDGVINLLRLFNDKNWREARDLALLALISYQPKDAKEDKALAESTENADADSAENQLGD